MAFGQVLFHVQYVHTHEHTHVKKKPKIPIIQPICAGRKQMFGIVNYNNVFGAIR